jgi:hypothetical protein
MLGILGETLALIYCPECRKRISESAIACPHCGYMLTPEVVAAQKEEEAKAAQALAEHTAAAERESNIYKGIAICATVVVFGGLFILGFVNRRPARAYSTYASAPYTPTVGNDDREIEELDDIKQALRRRQYSSDPADKDLSDINRRLEPIRAVANSRLEQMNRKPWQPGYSLEVRREAAIRTLIHLGDSPEEARRNVEAMERHGMLPDPPRQ